MAKRSSSRTPPAASARDGLEIPLPDEGLGSARYWADEVAQSERRLQPEVTEWRKDLQRYGGARPTLYGVREPETISVNVQFYTVEQKRPQLFYQTPFVQATSDRPEGTAAAPMFEQVINQLLGRAYVRAEALVDEVLNDCLISAGLGCTKIGYDSQVVPVEMPTGAVDPVTGQPVMDPTTGQPETVAVPKTIWCNYYWRRFSPADLRLPAGFTSSNYDEAPWVGWRFALSPDELKDTFGVEAPSLGAEGADLSLMDSADRRVLAGQASGIELWYKASLYDPSEKNPERIRQLVVIPRGRRQGGPAVVVHRNSPYQRFDADGAFTVGMRGFPVHILTLRTRPDSAYPPSDCRMLRDVADEKSLGRSQMVQQRRRNLPIRGFNKNLVGKDVIQRIERGEVQSLIPMDVNPQEALAQIAPAQYPRENFQFDEITQQDIDRIAASGANQQGLPDQSTSTATEASLIQRAADTRLAKERERLLSWYLGGVEKLAALVQLFADHTWLTRVLGPQGAAELETWDKGSGEARFVFALKPDSSVRTDAAEERQRFLQLFNLSANHPGVNSTELLKLLFAKWDLDPSKLIAPPPPPPPAPPAHPNVSIALKGDDLNPLAPQYANVITLLQLAGVLHLQAPPAPAAPPGAARPVPPINQHHADLTGQRPGPRPLA